MPEISRFLGIIIRMFADEHNPPHFHAIYQGEEAAFLIENFKMIEGKLPDRVRGLIVEWASLHREELLENWKLLQNSNPPKIKKIKPLV